MCYKILKSLSVPARKSRILSKRNASINIYFDCNFSKQCWQASHCKHPVIMLPAWLGPRCCQQSSRELAGILHQREGVGGVWVRERFVFRSFFLIELYILILKNDWINVRNENNRMNKCPLYFVIINVNIKSSQKSSRNVVFL